MFSAKAIRAGQDFWRGFEGARKGRRKGPERTADRTACAGADGCCFGVYVRKVLAV